MSFRHRSSWQNAARVCENRADLLRYIHKTAKKMGIQYKHTHTPQAYFFEGGPYKPKESDEQDSKGPGVTPERLQSLEIST
jgi:hypothetical protein